MKNLRSGLSNIIILVFLVGLATALIAIFNSLGTHSARPSTSPVPTIAGTQTSPLPTPIATSVPLARIGAPVAMQTTGQLGPMVGAPFLGVVKKDKQEYLVTFDPTTGQEHKLLDKNPWWPRLSGHWLTYVDQQPLGEARYSDQIKVLDINTGKEVSLAKGDAVQTYPSISGDTVVWLDSRNRDREGPDIYAYDLATKKETPVAGGPGYRTYPKTSGKWVIYLQWMDKLPEGRGIWPAELRAHSLETGEDFSIGPTPHTLDSFFGTYHAIDGDKVAWTRFNANDYTSELHLYDLTTRTDRQLTKPRNGSQALLSISAQAGLVTYNDAGPWVILDYLQPAPTVVPFTSPIEYLGGYQLVGNYLIAQTSVKRTAFEEPVFATYVMKITR